MNDELAVTLWAAGVTAAFVILGLVLVAAT